MLGRCSDCRVARIAGVSQGAIRYRRELFGIAAWTAAMNIGVNRENGQNRTLSIRPAWLRSHMPHDRNFWTPTGKKKPALA